ncbi:alpha/beta hydrolase [Actinophytocola sp.]|uniref:alpha/beta hydrolase n=1 Tax=Actinophytocola sp. TaxID=1872138 RepID=UPI002ED48B98
MTENKQNATIVLIHGLWLTPRSWEHWITRYTERGHQVLAPAWPGMEIEVEALRANPSVTDGLGLGTIADHYERIIRDLDEPPIIMGHSFGGALVQIMLSRGLGLAGVALHPAPVRGVYRLPASALRSSFPVLRNPANRHRTVGLTYAQWRYAFTNTMSDQDSRTAYDRYHVPSTGRPLFQAATANLMSSAATAADFTRSDRAPLLLVAGGSDHVVPPSMVRENAKRYGRSGAVTAYHEFPGRPHFTTGAPGWRDMADYVLNWAVLNTPRGVHPELVPETAITEPRPRTP